LFWASFTSPWTLVADEVVLLKSARAEDFEVGARCKGICNHELWLIVILRVFACAFHMANMGLAKPTGEPTSCLHVVVERGVVAIVCKVQARGLRSILEPHTSNDGVIARWSFGLAMPIWIALETCHRADFFDFCGVAPVIALGHQVRAARIAQEALVCVHLKTSCLRLLVLAACAGQWLFMNPRICHLVRREYVGLLLFPDEEGLLCARLNSCSFCTRTGAEAEEQTNQDS